MISSEQAARLQEALGRTTPFEARNIISVIDNIQARRPASPLTGNTLFQGAGEGLPNGGRELTIPPIPSAGGPGIRQIILEVQ